jgi:hypothetical protein
MLNPKMITKAVTEARRRGEHCELRAKARLMLEALDDAPEGWAYAGGDPTVVDGEAVDSGESVDGPPAVDEVMAEARLWSALGMAVRYGE